ncbi:hypothetical protein VNO77_10043 [Canavalia gladiata]|uniref:Uncharacterized protein n=1 Tax=Canavalia gladiata TaxID=3824 RepID=A0AAN9QWW4_CANGL
MIIQLSYSYAVAAKNRRWKEENVILFDCKFQLNWRLLCYGRGNVSVNSGPISLLLFGSVDEKFLSYVIILKSWLVFGEVSRTYKQAKQKRLGQEVEMPQH